MRSIPLASAVQDTMGHAQGKADELGSKAQGKAEELKHKH